LDWLVVVEVGVAVDFLGGVWLLVVLFAAAEEAEAGSAALAEGDGLDEGCFLCYGPVGEGGVGSARGVVRCEG
jgi:hypothetical protein